MIQEFYDLIKGIASNDIFVLLFAFIFSLVPFYYLARSKMYFFKIFIIVLITSIFAFIGARVFHILFERPILLQSSLVEIFSRFDGMSFNGSLILGCSIFGILTNSFFKERQSDLWQAASISTSFTYGVMRLGCFSKGCCWGKISSSAFAVKHTHPSIMPFLGIPVHPVQLYDSLLGFFIFILLILLKKNLMIQPKHYFPLFLLLYSIGRFLTEFYRADHFRGVNVLWGLSTSQIISIITFLGLTFCYRKLLWLR